ncbi:MAG: LemA family protein [Cyclobacteriaceae bacterium]
MKKYIGIGALVLVALWGISAYNGLVGSDEGVQAAWGKVESQYQRRADLIPNLVNTVKGAAENEKGILVDVIEARAKATQTTIDPSKLTPEMMKKFQAAQGELSSALSRLLVTVERYPDIKSNQNFLELQAQLEGTENRITVARDRFNDVVKPYNSKVRSFPTVLIAKILGFDAKGYFESQPGADVAPTVQF